MPNALFFKVSCKNCLIESKRKIIYGIWLSYWINGKYFTLLCNQSLSKKKIAEPPLISSHKSSVCLHLKSFGTSQRFYSWSALYFPPYTVSTLTLYLSLVSDLECCMWGKMFHFSFTWYLHPHVCCVPLLLVAFLQHLPYYFTYCFNLL